MTKTTRLAASQGFAGRKPTRVAPAYLALTAATLRARGSGWDSPG